MAKFLGHYPCNHCDSSDGVGMYDDGRGKCFSCNKVNFLDQYDPDYKPTFKRAGEDDYMNEKLSFEDIAKLDSRGVEERKITKSVSEFFGMKVTYNPDMTIESHYYPYTIKGKVVAYKKRTLPKQFQSIGQMKEAELFGQDKFTGGRTLVITEGELDAMAVAQANMTRYKRIFPVVSLPSSTGLKALLRSRDWVRQFDSVILMLDQDEAGQKSLAEAAKIVGWDKARVAQLPEKDPCDTLIKHGPNSIIDSIFNARPYTPASIVRGEDIWEAYLTRKSVESVPYPECLAGLNDKLDGMRKGEITLFTSGTGSGKSTMIKEIILQLKKETEDNIGLVSLEESIGDSADKFISMFVTDDNKGGKDGFTVQERESFEQVFGDERLILLDHNGAVSDSSLIDQIENLCLLGCEYIILDHITIAVSEGADGKTGNEAIDSIMSDLLKVVKKHNVWLGLISHLRKSQGKSFEEGHLASIDDIKGSGSIKQISFDIITFARNMVAENEDERNMIRLRVLKSRFTGRTGDAGSAYYDTTAKRLKGQMDFMDFKSE